MIRVADFILQQLAKWGVRRIYGVTGDAIFPLMDALGKQNDIEFVLTKHEAAAGFMASAEAKLTGRPGVCMATSGPGVTNLLNGLADASEDHVPVIAITGQVASDKIGTGYKQYIDQQTLVRPIADYTAQISHPDGVFPILSQAFKTAVMKQTVAHLSLPKDVGDLFTDQTLKPAPDYLEDKPDLSSEAVSKAIQLVEKSQRPMILIGKGSERAGEQIKQLAEKISAGVIASLGAKGIVPDSFPSMLGGIGSGGSKESAALLQESDLLVMIGATWFPKEYVPEDIAVVQIDLHPGHVAQDKTLAGVVAGDAAEALQAIIPKVNKKANAEWGDQIIEAHESHQRTVEHEKKQSDAPVAPANVIGQLQDAVQEDAIITVDTGEHTVWFNRIFQAQQQQVLFSGNWRSMGFALPAAIAAYKSVPGKQVVALTGDGGLAMSMGELATIAENQLPITVVVVNDKKYTLERNKMLQEGKQPFGVSLYNPDFSQLAQAYGIEGLLAKSVEDVNKLLPTALASRSPVLLDVWCQALKPESTKPVKKQAIYS